MPEIATKTETKATNAKHIPSKILVDGGDPKETERIKAMIGFVDGQTTNPSLVAKNPEVAQIVKSGRKLTVAQQNDEYRKIVRSISPLVRDAGVSIEVFAELDTPAEQLMKQAREMNSWIPNAYIKFPCTKGGLEAAHQAVAEGIHVNITLCFSQKQAAAVYAATKGAKAAPVYVSPFIGRLDDIGQNGMDLIKNIKKMYAAGDGHVHVLAASIRNLQHLLCSFHYQSELVTVPTKVLTEWADAGLPLPDKDYSYKPVGAEIAYENLDLNRPWQEFDIHHELTVKGITKFVADYRSTIQA